MNAEAQRIAIAEAVGWLGIEHRDSVISGRKDWLSGLNPKPDQIVSVTCAESGDTREPNESDYGWETLPDYLHDLNAMHEAERVLTGDQALKYGDELNRATKRFRHVTPVIMCMATAAQRAEAFLRTIGKWID